MSAKAMRNFNQLIPDETERLAIMAEECSEVIQIIGKILRHGFDSTHPDGGPENRQLLEKELGDLRHAERLLIDANDVCDHSILAFEITKANNIKKYLHHQT